MESGFERELSRAATIIDDVLSDAYKPLPAQKADADIAARGWQPGAALRRAGTGRCSPIGSVETAGRSIRF